MKGFFTAKQTESLSRPDGKILSCASCGLYRNCKTPKIQPIGNFEKKILIVGSAPERMDDRQGKVFQSLNADLLKRTLAEFGIDMFEDCLLTYACHCYNPESDEPTNYEVECCRKTTLQTVEKYKPILIILLGDAAVYSLIGHRWKKDLNDIYKWRGWAIPDQDFKAWICPTFNMSELKDKNGKDKPEVMTIWKADLQNAVQYYTHLKVPIQKEPTIKILKDDELSILSTITGEVAFDYETTGLKPHAEGHKIICVSVAVSHDLVYAFLLPERKKYLKPFLQLLENNKIGKIAQNMKYEDTWSKVILNCDVQNWVWDTMLATHILDNRTGVSGLKFQTYVQFGVVDYDSEVNPYLKAKDEENANSINRIEELLKKPNGKELLLKYCALDSIYEYRLAYKQRSFIELPF